MNSRSVPSLEEDMIRRVAMAMRHRKLDLRHAHDARLKSSGLWPDTNFRCSMDDLALAAIEALQEPTDEMLNAANGCRSRLTSYRATTCSPYFKRRRRGSPHI